VKRLISGLILTAAACAAGAQEVRVVASIFPVADIARRIGGDLAQVEVLLPSGASPHTFDPTPRDVRMLSDADVFFAIGLGLEHWAEDLVVATIGDQRRVVVSDGITLIGGDPPNPHVWLDPLRAKAIASSIARAYASLRPGEGGAFAAREQRYRDQLDSLHAWILSRTEDLTCRRFLAFHPAWVYFAERYGLQQVAVVEEFPGKEPSPRHLAHLVKLAREAAVSALFAEPQLSARAAETLAREVGIGVAVIDPLGGAGLPGRDSYIGLMRWNTDAMVRALSARP
jgi:zinc transport system substrate-binding protein